MGNVIRTYIIRYMAVLLVLVSILYTIAGYVIWHSENIEDTEGEIRVMVNQLIYELEATQGGGAESTDRAEDASNVEDADRVEYIEFALPYCVLKDNGTVLMSTSDRYETGEQIDLHTLGGRDSYIVPITTQTAMQELLYVDCSSYHSSKLQSRKVFLIGFCGLIWAMIVLVLLQVRRKFHQDILEPVQQLHQSAKDMFAGNLSTKVQYDYDGEIGMLCHDYEKMREEIEDSHNRELQLREKIHVMYASISHDLKTPLATITGYLENILYEVVTEPEQIKNYLNRMLNKSQVLNQLIDDILEHSKAELNHLSIRKQEVYTQDYFGQLLHGYESEAGMQGYTLQAELPENCIINLDPDRIREVFENIIGNAIKYGQKDVAIIVHFQQIEQVVPMLLVSIQDNGPGIDAADLPFIFDVFYRGNKARTLNVPGSGLGLNIARYIIEEHGGQIECDSVVGVGTTISFSIPL